MDYSKYTFIDFMMDESFKQWVIQPNKHTGAYWKQVATEHPHLGPAIERATDALLKFKHRKAYVESPEVEHRLRMIYDP